MDVDEIVRRLEPWAQRRAELHTQLEAFRKLTGAMPDCDLLRPIHEVWTAYIVAISEIVGDENEWLQWFEYECEMGRNAMGVTTAKGKTMKVRTLRQFARLIAHG